MAKNLVIVESPAKAKTIEGFLGKDFLVKSSYGHVRDLSKEKNGVDIENNFQPIYEVSEDKKQVVSELTKLAKASDLVWLASDEDREGEAISWHLKEVLKLDEKKTKRIVFHEITKGAILKAIENPRSIDYNLVNAQQARRVLDRLVGFEISPVLWRKVKPSLSAGRVQSVAVRLIVEREREISGFNTSSAFKIVAIFMVDGKANLKAELSQRFTKEADALKYIESCKPADYTIDSLETKPFKKTPSAPFTTSTLQQEAGRKLRFSVSRTMRVAQSLYESGKITYMRTDSVSLSETAREGAKNEVLRAYGPTFHHERQFKTKSASAQEAHEAIRPTDFTAHTVPGERDEQALYELIWKRSIASQMADAQLERTTAKILISTTKDHLTAQGEVLKFEGFLKAYLESEDEDHNEEEQAGMLPPLKVGQELDLLELSATERFTRAQPRYTESSLVKKLEELGIGRPSTYAPTISTIQKRGYVVKEDRDGVERQFRNITLYGKASNKSGSIETITKKENTGAEKAKLFPTDIGSLVNDFLVEHFSKILDFEFTADVEKEFDDIAAGNQDWHKMLATFYKPFHENVELTKETSERVTGERILGNEPETGLVVSVRMSRYGAVAQKTDPKDEEAKPIYASLKAGQSLETVTLEDALELFKLPRTLGNFEDKTTTVALGRFGPYVRHDAKFFSLKKEQDPMTITLEEAIELIEQKRIADIEKYIKSFDEDPELKVLNGRWGPYLNKGKENYKIPKDTDAAALTYEECLQLIEASEKAPKKKFPAKKKAK